MTIVRTLRSASCFAAAVLLSFPLPAQPDSPAGPVPVARLVARRAALAHRMGTGVAILRSADERDDLKEHPQDAAFRQDNDFFYLTGLESAGSWLVLVARDSQLATAVLYLPARDSVQERWTGPTLGPGPEASALTGIREVRPADAAAEEIRALVLAPRSPAASGALFVRRSPIDRDTPLFVDLAFADRSLRLEDLRGPLGALRLIKDDDEQRRMREAVRISTAGHLAAQRITCPGVLERALEAEAEATFRRLGAERVGYPSIVGAGYHGTTLHYDQNRGESGPTDLIVMDMGAEYGYYTADVTRTVPASGKFTPRQRAIYDLVLATQQIALDSIRPGVTLGHLDSLSRRYMHEHSSTLCGPRACDAFYIHSLSHWLGMDVHDVGRRDTPLTPGMVFTVEPGIYLPEEKLGVRIEDDVLVTATGAEVLSKDAPRTASAIEQLMAGRGHAVCSARLQP